MDESEAFKAQIHFLDLVRHFTNAGRAEWLRSAAEPGFVYCLVDGEDLIVFECRGGAKGDEPVPPTDQVAGIVSHFCNATYLWLTGLADWELLLQLLRSAKIDEQRFIQCRRIAHSAPIRVLETRLKR